MLPSILYAGQSYQPYTIDEASNQCMHCTKADDVFNEYCSPSLTCLRLVNHGDFSKSSLESTKEMLDLSL